MKATKTLPEQYTLSGTLDFSGNKWVALAMNGVALGLLALFSWLALHLTSRWHPAFELFVQLSSDTISPLLMATAGMIVLSIAMFALHEAVHGLFFWLFTRERPHFGHNLKSLTLYAAAPDWYLTRNQHLIVGMAPLVLISGLALLASWLSHSPWITVALLFVAVMNASGAAGDMIVAAWELAQPRGTLVRDTGDAFTLYRPAQEMTP